MNVFVHLLVLAFFGSVGMMFIFLACALPEYNAWWPMLIIVFFLLAPLPTLIAHRASSMDYSTEHNTRMHWTIFFTMFFVVSSYAVPILLARYPVSKPAIKPGACMLTLTGTTIIHFTYVVFFLTLFRDINESWTFH